MTRKRLQKILILHFLLFMAILAGALACKLSGNALLFSVYEFIRDMSLIFVTLAAAYLAHVFQKRANFLQSLRDEWREIVDTKSALVAYCEQPDTQVNDFVEARRRISQAIDYMRIVYKNILESDQYIGFYPYEPLHDMRRALNSIDPRKRNDITFEDKRVVKRTIVAAFLALRENFLEEFDLQEPTNPVTGSNRLRKKISNPK
ncbi:MAG: hypothetical protein L3J67_11815 [Hyphomicrobiaceae bacterium]|nr:hypothetical protein [Hyphomicrobiaceae bacterium]